MNTFFSSNVFLIVLLVAPFPTQILAQNLAICSRTQFTKLCIDTLKSDSAGKSATTIDGVAMIMLNHAISTANKINDEITKLLKQATSSWGGDVVALVNCSKYYQDAIGKLANSKKALESRNYNAIKNPMSDAMSATGKCDQDFKKLGKNGNSLLGYDGDTYVLLCKIVLQLTTRK